MRLEQVKKSPKRAGKADLIKHLEAKRLTQKQAIRAKCFDCSGLGESDSCFVTECPLWPFSPYRQKGLGLIPDKGSKTL